MVYLPVEYCCGHLQIQVFGKLKRIPGDLESHLQNKGLIIVKCADIYILRHKEVKSFVAQGHLHSNNLAPEPSLLLTSRICHLSKA